MTDTRPRRNGRKKPPGPAPKLNADIQTKIVETIAAGAYMETAAAYAGVNSWTFKDWLRTGRDGLRDGRNNIYTRFVEAVEQARAQSEVARVARIAKAGQNGEWQADAWWLERSYPDRYSKRTRVDGQVQIQAIPLIDPDKLTPVEIETLIGLLAKAAPDSDDPALTAKARPALELVQGDVIDMDSA